MNIDSSKIKQIDTNTSKATQIPNKESGVKFSEELSDLKTAKDKTQIDSGTKNVEEKNTANNDEQEINGEENPTDDNKLLNGDGLLNIKIDYKNSEEKNSKVKNAFDEMNSIVNELHQSDDKNNNLVKENADFDDKNSMINNDFNISENKDLLPQMNPNMNFSGNGQPFSSFMQENTQQNQGGTLSNSAKDLAEENAILSTMAENIAIANKNTIIAPAENNVKEKVVNRNDDIKKIDVKSGIVIETVVKHDSIIMNQADVEMFANIVENNQINLNDLTSESAIKSVKISKTLADMLIKAKETNQPLRIDFDNNISVIIKISRDGKISADFLPSSQVAEAYLKENLPLLRQRFDDNNIKYDELNQRERKEQNREHNRKKGRNDE